MPVSLTRFRPLYQSRIIWIIALGVTIVMPIAARDDARGGEATIIGFSCDGKKDSSFGFRQSERIQNEGLVVNFAEKTVSFENYVGYFGETNSANIDFNNYAKTESYVVFGHIDRVTGFVRAVPYKARLDLR